MTQVLLYGCGLLAGIAAAGVAWFIRWLNTKGLEVIPPDIPDHVPAYLVELVTRGKGTP